MKKIICLITSFIMWSQVVGAVDKELKKFDSWLVLEGQEKNKKYCYAVSTPFETRAYYSQITRYPYILIVYVAPNRFTIGIDSGYVLDHNNEVSITVANKKRSLAVLPMYKNAITYSSVEDSYLIDDMIESEGEISVESFGTEDRRAVDYYSMKPIKQVLNYMINKCN